MAVSLRDIPAVHRFTEDPAIAAYGALLGGAVVKRVIESMLSEVRASIAHDGAGAIDFESLRQMVLERLADEEARGLLEVINATGVHIHTNLGRIPLAAEALDAMRAIGAGYSNLEYDIESGQRGSRYARLTTLLREATGAEDALVVNNCAAAILLILDTFATGREVIVSRNQLIEIGGGFRLPDVLAKSGAHLVEVGATNKVYIRDYERALTANTALLLRSHPSNYRIEGFVADVSAAELAALGKRAGVPSVEDLGSGSLVDLARFGLPREPTVQDIVAAGIDLVAFSGDKLLGGPQAGIIVGKRALIARLRANPLLRALRVDKTTIAALGATLRLYLSEAGLSRIPLFAMLAQSYPLLQARLEAIRSRLPAGATSEIVASQSYVGGGALPLAEIATPVLALRAAKTSSEAVARALRMGRPPVIARIEAGRVLVDVRTVLPGDDERLIAALTTVF